MKSILLLFFFCFSLSAQDFLEEQRLEALKAKKLILLGVMSERCPYCQKMKQEVYAHPSIKQRIDTRFLSLLFLEDDPRLPKSLHVKYLPTHYVLSPKTGEVLELFEGMLKADDFLELLEEVYAQEAPKHATP